MRILKLTEFTIKPAIASVFISKKNQQKYFNLWHGSRGLKVWGCGMNKRTFNPTDFPDKESIELKDNNYVITPIPGLTNPGGKPFYSIYTDNVESHTNDVLLLWEIPNKRYTNVTYVTSGDCHVVGSGETGSVRDDIEYISPAPVIEIFGSCVLAWKGYDINNNIISQEITFDYPNSQWNVPALTMTSSDKGDTNA
jgi:hypothetical protein